MCRIQFAAAAVRIWADLSMGPVDHEFTDRRENPGPGQ